MIEVGIGLEIDNFWVTLGEMIEVAVDQDQELEYIPIETE